MTSADQTVQRLYCNRMWGEVMHTYLLFSISLKKTSFVHTTWLTSEQGNFVEGALQLSHQDMNKAVFGQVPCLFGTLVINHHFLLPAQLDLCVWTNNKEENQIHYLIQQWKICQEFNTNKEDTIHWNVAINRGISRHQWEFRQWTNALSMPVVATVGWINYGWF